MYYFRSMPRPKIKPKEFVPTDRASWRDWLARNHRQQDAIKLVLFKKDSGKFNLSISDAIDEALCFGWIDSTPGKRDDLSFTIHMAPRNPKSNWSAVNKRKVERLIANNLMTPSGMEMIVWAKETGTWNALDAVEEGVLPDDLRTQLLETPMAMAHWEAFPRSAKRGILEWILAAKKPETRMKRVLETAEKAARNKKANFPEKKS
jgi:uncharacterized protein YdeI (YjbR/CyaY-like superfamily)